MKFDLPATRNPIDQLDAVGKPILRIDGRAKTTGTAPYAYERNAMAPNHLYGHVIGAGIAKGRITNMDCTAALAAPGVKAIVNGASVGELGLGRHNTAKLLAGPDVDHYHQAIAVVVAETFEQARAAAGLVRVRFAAQDGAFDLAARRTDAQPDKHAKPQHLGDFESAFAAAPVTLDATYTTPDQTHAMMEPFATIAAWRGDRLDVWTSNQMIASAREDLATTLGIEPGQVHVSSPFVGGGFGGKLFLRADVVLAALAARAAGQPVKVALTRPLMANNATHRAATIQRIRLAATPDGRLTAIGHESWSGNLPGGRAELAAEQTKLLYAAPNRSIATYNAVLDLPEGNAMRAPGEAPGLMALEIAMDELAEKLGIDPIDVRLRNDTAVDPAHPNRPFSQRELVQCLTIGAERFGWRARQRPGQRREGRTLIGLGVAAGFRNSQQKPSAARVRLDPNGSITVQTDMTDIGTGSYTIIAQTAAETMGVPLDRVAVELGDSDFPVSCGSGGQFGATNSTSGVYAACMKLRGMVAQRLGINSDDATFVRGFVRNGNQSVPLAAAAQAGPLVAEDGIEYGNLAERFQQSTFAGHFVEVGVDVMTGTVRVRRMLAVCSAGRILNPVTARSQVIGAMTMGVGAALMEELAVDTRVGFFVNHDLAGYEVPVHADIPHQEVILLDDPDPVSSPMKAKGIGELGLCGVGAAVANAIYNATGIRVRDYPITLDKLIDRLPAVA